MRRGRRELREKNYSKHLLFFTGGIFLVIILTFAITFVVYNNKELPLINHQSIAFKSTNLPR